MSSSAFTVYPPLPPTTNILSSQQRLRLMRSTRKLCAVLGTTPCLLENDTSFALLPLGKTTPTALKRQGSIFTHYQSSSLSLASSSTSTSSLHHPSPPASSIALPQTVAPCAHIPGSHPSNPPGLSTVGRPRLGDKPPQLRLQLNAVPVSPTDRRRVSSLPPTPSTPCPLSPITPPVPDVTEIRRRRIAKLARHLGESIPAELVVTPEPAPRPSTTSPPNRMRRRSRSVRVVRPQGASISANNPSLSRSEPDWVGEWNRPNIEDVQRELRNLRVQ